MCAAIQQQDRVGGQLGLVSCHRGEYDNLACVRVALHGDDSV